LIVAASILLAAVTSGGRLNARLVFSGKQDETTDARSFPVIGAAPEGSMDMAPRQKPPRTANPDLYHLISREGYFRSRRPGAIAETE